MESDIVFVAPMVKLADLLNSAGVEDITFFSFDYRSPSSTLQEWEGNTISDLNDKKNEYDGRVFCFLP